MTLRKAIAQLARERCIVLGGRGRQHSIRKKRFAAPKPTGRIIRVLTPYSRIAMGAVSHTVIETVTERVATAGYRVEFEYRPRLFQRHQPEELRRLDALPDTAGWLLFFSTEPMQRWFAASGRPCVAVGSLYEGVQLSCVYPEPHAAARHAAGRFYARGHRELVYLIAKFTSLSDRRASMAFVEEAHRLGANARIVEHDGNMISVHRVISELLAMRPRPSGFLTGSPECSITTLCCLLSAGLRIPTDAAIVSIWNDDYLDHTVPTIARYRIDGIKMGRKIANVFLNLLQSGPGKIYDVRILPEFVNGGTLDELEAAKIGRDG